MEEVTNCLKIQTLLSSYTLCNSSRLQTVVLIFWLGKSQKWLNIIVNTFTEYKEFHCPNITNANLSQIFLVYYSWLPEENTFYFKFYYIYKINSLSVDSSTQTAKDWTSTATSSQSLMSVYNIDKWIINKPKVYFYVQWLTITWVMLSVHNLLGLHFLFQIRDQLVWDIKYQWLHFQNASSC